MTIILAFLAGYLACMLVAALLNHALATQRDRLDQIVPPRVTASEGVDEPADRPEVHAPSAPAHSPVLRVGRGHPLCPKFAHTSTRFWL